MEERCERRGEGHVKMEEEVEMVQLQTRKCLEAPGSGRSREQDQALWNCKQTASLAFNIHFVVFCHAVSGSKWKEYWIVLGETSSTISHAPEQLSSKLITALHSALSFQGQLWAGSVSLQSMGMQGYCFFKRYGFSSHVHYSTKTRTRSSHPEFPGEWRRTHEIPPLVKELLAVYGCWGKETQYFFRDATPARLLHLRWCLDTHAHMGCTKWTQ